MYVLGLRLGLRPGEATGLHWADFDARRGHTQRDPRRAQLTHGRAAVVDELKTKDAKRTLGLPADLVEQFRAHRAAQARSSGFAAADWADEALVFASRGVRCCRLRMYVATSPRSAAGLPTVRPNELRHSCAVSDRLGRRHRDGRRRARPHVDADGRRDLSTSAATGDRGSGLGGTGAPFVNRRVERHFGDVAALGLLGTRSAASIRTYRGSGRPGRFAGPTSEAYTRDQRPVRRRLCTPSCRTLTGWESRWL